MRVGLFGGSFNPIHLGHLRAAEEVREEFALDLVYFVPAASPPHKVEGDLAPAEHRLQMVRLGTKGNRHFMVSDTEIKRLGRSYTVDTVRYFLSNLRAPATLYLMLGSDLFVNLDTWKECGEIVRLTNIIVHTRREAAESESDNNVFALLKRFNYSKSQEHYVHPSGHTASFIATTYFPVSASQIRQKLQRHESIRYLTPGDVSDYIARHGIY